MPCRVEITAEIARELGGQVIRRHRKSDV